MDIKKLVLGIHDLNSWGGQERSNLEIFYRLNSLFPIELHSYTFNDQRLWPALTHETYNQRFANPVLLKINHFHAQSLLKLNRHYLPFTSRKRRGVLLQSVGTALPTADVIQVQYVHKAWNNIEAQLPDAAKTKKTLSRSTYDTIFNGNNELHEKLIYTNSKKYIAVSHSVKKDLMLHYGIKSENITVIYHGVDTETFRPRFDPQAQFARKQIRHQYSIPEEACVLLTVGALNARKGLHVILETIRELVANGFTSIALVAVGAGHPTQFLNQAEQWGLSKYIYMVPSQKDVAPFYQAADIFFFPTMYEPFGLVILEAMASGLAVVTSSVAGAAELITPGRDGVIIGPERTAEEIASEISLLLKDGAKLKSLGQRAAESARNWDWDKVSQNYAEFYKGI